MNGVLSLLRSFFIICILFLYNMSASLIISKIFSSICLGLSALIGCSIPYLLRKFTNIAKYTEKKDVIDKRLCLTNCLGSGIILGISFLHILPETLQQANNADLFIKINNNRLSLSYVILLSSFVFMLLVERVFSSGRDPCSSSFNDCSTNTKCCTIDPPPTTSSSLHHNHADDDVEKPLSKLRVNRYPHKHTKFLQTIKNILCPLCACNGLCITLALSIHSIFEGIVVGLEDTVLHLWLVAIGIMLHKWAAGMALSSFITDNSFNSKVFMFSIFCLGSPLGVLIGAFISSTNLVAIAVLNSLAVGTLIYVGIEILVHELFCDINCKRTALIKWFCVVAGISIIFVSIILEFYIGTEHNCCGHHHGH